MKIDTEQKRFLENFYKYLSNKKIITPEWRDYHSRKEIILRFSKNLALGKPEPLAKNKDSESKCDHNGPRFNPEFGQVVCSLCYKRLE